MIKHVFGLRSPGRSLMVLGAAVAAVSVLAACGSSSGGSSSSSAAAGAASSSTASSSAAASSSSASSGGSSKPLKIAYMSFAVQNSYDAPMLAAAQKVAAANNATVQVFDANNDPNKQYSELQDAITQGGFNGVITQPIESTNLTPLVKQAVAKGMKVVNIDQILGPSLSTSSVQVPGLSGNVTFVPTEMGQKLGKLVVQACESKSLNPCKVGYLYDIKASALDVAIHQGFQQAIAGSHATVVSEGQDFFLPAKGLAAVQTMLTSDPSINVIAGSDQGIEGAVRATSGKKVLLVGYGGSAAGIAGVKSGAWFGTISQDPASEGRVGMQTLINAIRSGKSFPGDNPLDSLPAGGVITKSNASQFTGEWPG